MHTHDAVLAAIATGPGKGHVETVVLIVGLVIGVLLLAISIVVATSSRGRATPWFGLTVAAFFITIMAISYI